MVLAIFAAIAAPDWFARSKDGLESPALPEDLLGLLAIVIVGVQILLVVVSMIGFSQEWHVEEERPIDGRSMHGDGGKPGSPAPAPA